MFPVCYRDLGYSRRTLEAIPGKLRWSIGCADVTGTIMKKWPKKRVRDAVRWGSDPMAQWTGELAIEKI